MNGRQILGWNLRALRTKRGQSQEALAADTGLNRAYVSEIERGLGNATLDVLDRLATHFAVPHAALLAAPQDGDPKPSTLTPGRRPR